MTDFYARLEDQLVSAGRRRQAQGPVARRVAGRGRVLVTMAVIVALVSAGAATLPTWTTSLPTSNPTGPAGPAPAPKREGRLTGIRVAVFNATTQSGLARRVADQLRAHGADIAMITTAPPQPDARSIVLYRSKAKTQAGRVAALLAITTVSRYDATRTRTNPPARAPVIVLLGADRRGQP